MKMYATVHGRRTLATVLTVWRPNGPLTLTVIVTVWCPKIRRQRNALVQAMGRMQAEFSSAVINPADIPEMTLWEQQWIR